MSWTLRVFAPGTGPWSSSPTAQYTHTSPGGIVGGFRWSLDGDGDCVQMEFEAVPRLVDIPPRANVQLLINGSPVWFGTVVRTGAPGSGRSWRYVALGGRHMLKYAYANYAYNDPNALLDIATLAANAWGTVQNKPLNPTMSTRPTGFTLTRLTAQWVDVHTLLSDLARAAGDVPWGVNASGQVFFNKLPTSGRVSASQVDVDPLPVDADDVWGSVILYHPQSGYAYRYVGDARYGERVVVVPDIASYMDVVPGTYGHNGDQLSQIAGISRIQVTSIIPQRVLDWDRFTGYNVYVQARYGSGVFGFFFTPTNALRFGESLLLYTDTTAWWISDGQSVPDTPFLYGESEGYIYRESYLGGQRFIAFSPPVSTDRLWIGIFVFTNIPNYYLDVYDWVILQRGPKLDALAQSLLQPPYLSPQDIRITGYVVPTNYLHIDGLGTLEIDTWEYEYTMERGLLTTARVGRRGSEHQQSQRIAITGLSREWAERLRLSIGRTT